MDSLNSIKQQHGEMKNKSPIHVLHVHTYISEVCYMKRGLKVICPSLNHFFNKRSVCKTVMPPYCHIDTGSGTFHLLISKELIGKY